MPGTSLVVPVVLWGKHAPTHCISCIYLSRDQRTLATGCYDGQICLWQVNPDTLEMIPRCLLVGHTAPILCISKASIVQDNNYIVSSSEAGEMCTWDLVDGKCRECVKLPQVHTSMQAYHMSNCEDVRLFCNGYYPEVLVMDPFSLEILFALSSKVNPDWISALHVLRPAKRKDDVVLALTTTGMVKVWTLLGHENKHSEPIYENESKQIRCLNAVSMQCCAYNQRTVLIVCTKYWQIYDAGDFSVLCSYIAPRGERWMSGDFLAVDRIIVWSDAGKGYLYKLPNKKLLGKNINSCIPDNKDFHTATVETDSPFLYCILSQSDLKPLSCPPAMCFVTTQKQNQSQRYLVRGDSEGYVLLWHIPEVSMEKVQEIQTQKMPQPLQMTATLTTSLTQAWAGMNPSPVGVLDQIEKHEHESVKLTASIYLPSQCRLVVGREDGTIIIVPATQTVMLQLLHGNHQQFDGWPQHQVLSGHVGRVNCLLYPYSEHSRYDKTHLVSGGVDFAVCLWDFSNGNLLHRFCVHAGEITQLLVPPNICNTRVQKCICSVASDHSVTLLSLSEKKCVCLASRHLFPVTTIKWRPKDDFMIIGCSDGTVYVWQMETGHLDRVLQGIAAEEVLYACEENESTNNVSSEVGLANPAVHFFRGLRHRNLSAIRHATQRGLHQLQQLGAHSNNDDPHMQRSHNSPLAVQGLRTNPKDPESHILFFDIEALIIELLSEEYSAMTPGSLEAAGLISQSEYLKVAALTQSASPDAHKKIVDFFGKVKDKAENMERMIKEKDKHGILAMMKEGAENVHTKFQARSDQVSKQNEANSRDGGDANANVRGSGGGTRPMLGPLDASSHGMEIAQLLLSLLHAWGMDNDLDRVCQVKLGLLRPMVPLSFGVLSRGNYMSLFLPTWHNTIPVEPNSIRNTTTTIDVHSQSLMDSLPEELVLREEQTRVFTSRTHWELSTTLTSNHLLAIIALSHTLMSMSNATFVPEQERNRKLHRQSTRVNWSKTDEEHEEMYTQQQAQIKQGWSLLATLHCVLLPDKVVSNGAKNFKRPQVEMMAKRWQHHCVEVREAAQALLLAELGRMGTKGRKALVDAWSQYLPLYTQSETINQQAVTTPGQNNHLSVNSGGGGMIVSGGGAGGVGGIGSGGGGGGGGLHPPGTPEAVEDEYEEEEEEQVRKPSSLAELKRKQTTAVVLLGVIGAEFGQDITTDTNNSKRRQSGGDDQRRRGSFVDGFGIGNNNLARLTSMALSHLLLAPPSPKMPAHTPLRRAAIDLIGRGFTVWEPYLDISKVLLGLLELCSEADRLVPSMTYGLPLTPQADSCRTARHALTLIATARPAAFITTMAREVARYNAMQQNAQAINVTLNNTVLLKAKPEILRGVELLIEKMQNEMSELLVELMDIILHCLDQGHLKTKGLQEVFPVVCRFNQVSHCQLTRRIAVGANNGTLTLYELRQGKCTVISAHTSAITAAAFNPDGKFLVSYSSGENKLCFWQTSSGMLFGLGQSQTRCIKSYSTAPIADVSRFNPMRLARLIWINNRIVTLMLADGSETRFNV
ncbi:PREDICTED: WD repeat-containing protein 7 isoform X2 [Nicrophorus vespilloides]|uniref:WD repeat-containing protein 7 isoform X2 n=1 Tax=Nicrophorus vespilloides TaxID=110193 RepID=A0ABM1M1Q3_NICVS|nr:PREDICTED: WD repeat-containing protein 7 isoform X2 [Nicrophorus vespilloides]